VQVLSCLRVDRSGAYDMRAHFNFLLHLLCPPSTRLTFDTYTDTGHPWLFCLFWSKQAAWLTRLDDSLWMNEPTPSPPAHDRFGLVDGIAGW